MIKNRGKLIVLEGTDGAGTTTQATLLTEYLAETRCTCYLAQPSDGPIGTTIRSILDSSKGSIGPRPSETTMALLFAADRYEQQRLDIEPMLADGINVVCDRYMYSSVIYPGAKITDCWERAQRRRKWVHSLNQDILVPDLTIVLNINHATALERRIARGDEPDMYEGDEEYQQRVIKGYEGIIAYYPGHNIVGVDGHGSVDNVATLVREAVKPLFEEVEK